MIPPSMEEPFRQSADELIWRAQRVRLRAYAPYSKYLVGAVVSTSIGYFVGCNVESADYDGTHAEEAALAAMVAAGSRSPVTVIAVGGPEGSEPIIVPPCGKCRQKLMEFESLCGVPLNVILMVNGQAQPVPLAELLPRSFGPADIGVDLAKYRR